MKIYKKNELAELTLTLNHFILNGLPNLEDYRVGAEAVYNIPKYTFGGYYIYVEVLGVDTINPKDIDCNDTFYLAVGEMVYRLYVKLTMEY